MIVTAAEVCQQYGYGTVPFGENAHSPSLQALGLVHLVLHARRLRLAGPGPKQRCRSNKASPHGLSCASRASTSIVCYRAANWRIVRREVAPAAPVEQAQPGGLGLPPIVVHRPRSRNDGDSSPSQRARSFQESPMPGSKYYFWIKAKSSWLVAARTAPQDARGLSRSC